MLIVLSRSNLMAYCPSLLLTSLISYSNANCMTHLDMSRCSFTDSVSQINEMAWITGNWPIWSQVCAKVQIFYYLVYFALFDKNLHSPYSFNDSHTLTFFTVYILHNYTYSLHNARTTHVIHHVTTLNCRWLIMLGYNPTLVQVTY